MKEHVVDFVAKETGLERSEVDSLVEVPPSEEFGDYAFPCYVLAKKEKKSPLEISEYLAERMRKNLPKEISGVDFKSAYVNFFVDKKILAEKTLNDAGSVKVLEKKDILIDYSHPNVAKHFGIHNLRSTLIGNALYNILNVVGCNVKSSNYLGDWGTQFGKLIVAYKKWGSEIKDVEDLNKLYVKFHENEDEDLEEEAREEFKKLEQGDKENLELWRSFYEISMKEFERVYGILGIEFDEIKGESFYRDSKEVEDALRKNDLLEKSEGAEVVSFEEDIPPLIFKKSNESSTYASRDLGAILERAKSFEEILYVVDVAQSLHFQQVFDVAKRAGIEADLKHISFGRLKFKNMKMSTRKGQVILFEELFKKASDRILEIIEDKNPDLKDKKEVAEKVALSSIIFNDLKQDRNHDVVFDWEQALSFEGRSGPYLLYTYARASSVLRKIAKKNKVKIVDLNPEEVRVLKSVNLFSEVVNRSAREYAPHILADYLYELARVFNEFYHSHNVLGSKEEGFRVALVESFVKTMKKGLNLLGIEEVEEM